MDGQEGEEWRAVGENFWHERNLMGWSFRDTWRCNAAVALPCGGFDRSGDG
jgi:hypothetical protein